MEKKIIAIVVTYNPTESFLENILVIHEQLDTILIIDNGSKKKAIKTIEHVIDLLNLNIIFNKSNLGIATALNQGFLWAIEHNFEYALTFDQDSYPYPEMVTKLISAHKSHPKLSKIAVIAPNIIDQAVNIRSRHLRPTGKFTFELVSCEESYLDDVVFVITSGSLCSLSAYKEIGGFRDCFFIDYVEYCLHAQSLGYEIVVACEAKLAHRLGKRDERSFLGRKEYPRFHPPERWYYQSRNRIFVFKEYLSKKPSLLFYEGANTLYGIVRMLIFEDQRLQKMKAMIMGTYDGVMGNINKPFRKFLRK